MQDQAGPSLPSNFDHTYSGDYEGLMVCIGRNVLGGSRRSKKMMVQSLRRFCGEQACTTPSPRTQDVKNHFQCYDLRYRGLILPLMVTRIRFWRSLRSPSRKKAMLWVLLRCTKSRRCGNTRRCSGPRSLCKDVALMVRVPRRSTRDMRRRRRLAEAWVLCQHSSTVRLVA